MVSSSLPHPLCFYRETCRTRTHMSCVMSPHAQPLHHGIIPLPDIHLIVSSVCGLDCVRSNQAVPTFVESILQMCLEGKWLQNRLRADKNELRSLLAVDIKGHQRGGFCVVPAMQ